MKNWNAYENLCNRFNTNLGKRIIRKNHRGRRVEKTYNMMSNISRWGIYIGEIAIVLILSCISFLFGKGEGIVNNTRLVYPLYEVSLLSCRTMQWDTIPDSCKIKLPIIHGANFEKYKDNQTYKDIYTTHWGASYTSGWDNMVGTHYGTDIATAPGTPLYAIADGVVYSSVYNSAYGNVIKIKFQYQGEILYAVYAHMSERLVEAGDTVKAGDLIGKTGNSGNVFGALGGYHVHFEIDKDTNGRPAWVFSTCPTISKGDYAVIQAGECRMQLFQYTKDPIVLLEKTNAQYPNPIAEKIEKEEKTDENHGTPSIGNIQTGNIIIPGSGEKLYSGNILENNDTNSGELKNIEDNHLTQNLVSKEETTDHKENMVEDKQDHNTSYEKNSNQEIIAPINEKVNEYENVDGQQTSYQNDEGKKDQKKDSAVIENQKEQEIDLDFSEVDYYGKLFVDQYEIKITKNFGEVVSLSDSNYAFTLSLIDKRTKDKFHGTTSQPLVFVANNTNVSLTPSSTVLFNQGIATVKIEPKKVGNSYIILMLGNKKIGGISLIVQE